MEPPKSGMIPAAREGKAVPVSY